MTRRRVSPPLATWYTPAGARPGAALAWPVGAYQELARAVLLQAVKDCARRVMGDDGVLRYRDRGSMSPTAQSARHFLSTDNAGLAFWCAWLGLHPETAHAAAARMAAPEPLSPRERRTRMAPADRLALWWTGLEGPPPLTMDGAARMRRRRPDHQTIHFV